MSRCNHVTDGETSSTEQGDYPKMKKIMSLMLGMSLVLGAASVAFAQDKTDTSKTTGKKSKAKKAKSTAKKDTTKTT
jgi:hypothetical protein